MKSNPRLMRVLSVCVCVTVFKGIMHAHTASHPSTKTWVTCFFLSAISPVDDYNGRSSEESEEGDICFPHKLLPSNRVHWIKSTVALGLFIWVVIICYRLPNVGNYGNGLIWEILAPCYECARVCVCVCVCVCVPAGHVPEYVQYMLYISVLISPMDSQKH